MADVQINEFTLKSAPVSTDSIVVQSAGGVTERIQVDQLHKQKMGFFDYNDLATTGAPLVVTAVGSPVSLPNDEAGAQTIKSFAPTGVTDVWDAAGGVFDWSELSLGDTIDIRLSIDVITASPNTEVKVDLRLGTGAGEYAIAFIPEVNLKSAGTHSTTKWNGIYMGDTNTLDNGGVFKITTDTDCTVIVNGWYCRIIRR